MVGALRFGSNQEVQRLGATPAPPGRQAPRCSPLGRTPITLLQLSLLAPDSEPLRVRRRLRLACSRAVVQRAAAGAPGESRSETLLCLVGNSSV
ncbi:hypothetical protein H920_11215 [Fukomys damarensis]|uniref:Uncharacterized protein n=1 Tax=Fukomys damarensis TaxID=885580 RepID=A0A091D5M6_FUKDA|nr:hypothetical protein H920_11215 [Fukomys damarensis]